MVGCPSTDNGTETVVRPYAEVYNEDLIEIEDFMDSHFITVDADYNVEFTEITTTTPGIPISSHPDLTFKTVSQGGVDHKLYFLKLREGLGNTNTDTDISNDNPTKLDSIFSSYKGIKTDLTVFDTASNPVWFQLQDVIKGWQEIFPEFKRGNFSFNAATGITTYSDFGAGVMFVPSGLAYFNQSAGSIGTYTPIIFSFKLKNLKFKDHDGDKLLSKYEYGGPTSGTALDSDGDGKPDYGDFDDDNDGKYTKEEIRITPGVTGWYPFGSIPVCSPGGNGKPRHLDASCR